MGSRLSEAELQRSLDFCVNLFNPTSPEEHKEMERRLEWLTMEAEEGGKRNKIEHEKDLGELMDVTKPVVDPKTLEDVLTVGCCDREIDAVDIDGAVSPKLILDKINARRLVHSEYAINNLEAEELEGYAVRLEKGQLGLARVRN